MVKDKKAYNIYVYIVVDNIGYNTFINYNILCEQIFILVSIWDLSFSL